MLHRTDSAPLFCFYTQIHAHSQKGMGFRIADVQDERFHVHDGIDLRFL